MSRDKRPLAAPAPHENARLAELLHRRIGLVERCLNFAYFIEFWLNCHTPYSRPRLGRVKEKLSKYVAQNLLGHVGPARQVFGGAADALQQAGAGMLTVLVRLQLVVERYP